MRNSELSVAVTLNVYSLHIVALSKDYLQTYGDRSCSEDLDRHINLHYILIPKSPTQNSAGFQNQNRHDDLYLSDFNKRENILDHHYEKPAITGESTMTLSYRNTSDAIVKYRMDFFESL